MKAFYLFLSLTLLFQISCKTTVADPITEEVQGLVDVQKRKAYLEQIYKEDNQMRDQARKLVQQYGLNSEKGEAHAAKMKAKDAELLKKVEMYFAKYGAPTIKAVGRTAALAPWAVIHHSNDYDVKVRNFKFLNAAYRSEDIAEDAFSFYLNAMYKMKYGKRYEYPGRFKEVERIDSLIHLLELE